METLKKDLFEDEPVNPLRDHLPVEFFEEQMDSRAARFLDSEVVEEYREFLCGDRAYRAWPGREKNVHNWWLLENGRAVGWNENPARGWSFPVVKVS